MKPNINWKEYFSNAKLEYDEDIRWKPNLDANFFDREVIPILSSIPLVKNDKGKISASATIKNLPDIIKTPRGDYNSETVLDILGFIYYKKYRSDFVKGKMTANSRFGSFTPIAMYAQKLHNKIPYEMWDKKDPWIKFFLASPLEWLVTDTLPAGLPHMTHLDYISNRRRCLTFSSGRYEGRMAPLDYHLISHHALKLDNRDATESDDLERDTEEWLHVGLPDKAIQMVLQIWIANVAYRKPDVMILDPWNWDSVPKPLDAVQEATLSPFSRLPTGGEGLPWK